MDLKIDTDRKSCFIGDEEVILTRVEYNLLNLFVDNKNKVLNRREIANAVWDTKVSDRTVDAVVSRLRKKLKGIDLKTRTGFGYGLLE